MQSWKGADVLADVKMVVKNYKTVIKNLDAKRTGPKKVLKAVTADARKRVPGWVADEVTKVYGIKKSEITSQNVGKLSMSGKSVKDLLLIYTGRMLTPTHFSMSPKVPKEGAYTLKAAILKGQRKTLGKVKKLTKKQKKVLIKNFTHSGTQTSERSPVMLMRANGGHYLPFQRKSYDRKDIEAIKSISLPQMISSERTAPKIRKAIDEGLQKRMDHHMKRYKVE